MSSVRAIPPSLPSRPPISPTYVQMPAPAPQRASTVTSSSSSSSSASSYASSSSFRSPSTVSPPPLSHALSDPSMTGRTFDYTDYSDFADLQQHPAAFAAEQPTRSSSSSVPSHSHHKHQQPRAHRPTHQHQMSTEDRALAYRLQREEESRASEDAIRAGLTAQFAKAAGRPVDEVDLSALTLDEAHNAIEIQLRIRADKKKKRGLLGGLKARLSSKPRRSQSNTSPTTSSNSHLSVSVPAGPDGRQSPSPSPLPSHVDVDAMSYEELLALSEAIGDVKSKGFSEQEISRLPTAVWERKRAEGEPEDEPEPEPEPQVVEAQVAGKGVEGGAGEKKKKKGFFSRMRGSKKAPSPPASPPPSLPDDGKNEKAVVTAAGSGGGGGGGGGVEQWRDTCSICLEPFRNGEMIKFLPCLHRFHSDELDSWLVVNASCPICKEKPNLH